MTPDRTSSRRGDDRATLAVFCLALWLPLLATLLASPADESLAEKRRLAPAPEISLALEPLLALPKAASAYYDDHLAFRETLIRWRAFVWICLLGTSPSRDLLVGRDGWLFNANQHLRDPYRETGRVGFAELERWRHSFEERSDWLAARGISYLLVLAPMKSAIYPEHLPGWIEPAEATPFAQFARHLAEHSSLLVLDLEPVLLAAKAGQRVYHRTDIHWNDEGAYVAYRAILAALRGRVRAAEDWTAPLEVQRERRWEQGLGLTRQFRLENLLPEEILEVRPASPRAVVNARQREAIRAQRRVLADVVLGVGDPSLPRAVVFRDSFATALIPFLSEHFERVFYQWNMDVGPALVAREQPDVVIHEIWAGSLYGSRWGPRQAKLWRHPSRPWLER